MIVKNCKTCGTEFVVDKGNRKYCSKDCRKVADGDAQRHWTEKHPNYGSEYYQTHKEEFKKYYLLAKKRYHTSCVKNHSKRRKEDESYKRLVGHRADVRGLLRTPMRGNKPMKWLGCTSAEFKTHLESLFLPGMTWENRGSGAGKWHVEYVKPLHQFDFTDEAQRLEASNYTNIRPVWGVAPKTCAS